MADEARRAFFGLRTNVAYFASRVGFAKLDVRLRTAALLYDEVLLEGGVYIGTITDNGSFESVGPPIGPEDLKPLRTRRGAIAGLRMAPTGSNNFTTVMAGKTEQNFRSQFHSRFDAIPSPKPSWIQLVGLETEGERRAKKLQGEWNWGERDAVKTLFPDRSGFFRDRLHENLNFDLAQASLIGADLLPDGLNEPLIRMKIERGDVARRANGERPLRILIPDVAQASWSDLAELREWPGLKNLRAKLRELDGAELNDREIVGRIIAEYELELERRHPTWQKLGLKAALAFLGLVPGADTVIEGVAFAKESAELIRARTDWLATLIRAKHYLAEHKTKTESESPSLAGSAAS